MLTAQTCSANPCSVSPPTNGTQGTCSSVLASGGSCQFSCNSGYTLVGTATTCSAGVLSAQSCHAFQNQTIKFGTLSNQPFGSSPFTVSATASSGLPVAFSSLTTSVCTVAGATVTLAAPGTCMIGANQAGNSTYAAAPQVAQSFIVTAISGGTNPTDGPLPLWAFVALGAGLVGIASRRFNKAA